MSEIWGKICPAKTNRYYTTGYDDTYTHDLSSRFTSLRTNLILSINYGLGRKIYILKAISLQISNFIESEKFSLLHTSGKLFLGLKFTYLLHGAESFLRS